MWSKNKPQLGAKQNWRHPLSRGLLAHYIFNEGGGKQAKDIAGNYVGTLTNFNASASSGFTFGKFGKSITFDGIDDYIISGVNKTIAGNNFSLSFWIKPTGAQATVGVLQMADVISSTLPFILLQRTTSTTVRWYLNAAYNITQNISDDILYHIVLTYDGTTWLAYKNGVLDGTYVGVIGIANGINLWLGNGYNGYYKGLMEDVRFYTRTISVQDVRNLYVNPFADVRPSRNSWSLKSLSGGTPFSARAPYMKGVLSIKA